VLIVDRNLSLLLGLPAGTTEADQPFQNHTTEPQQNETFRSICTTIAARIIKRNQVSRLDLPLTQSIDKELISVTESTPSTFWRHLSFAGMAPDSVEAFEEVQRAWNHMCYFTLVIQLHLPHILCPSSGQQSIYSRMACVNASREILNREIAIRSFNPITASCRLGDFMSLIAGMTLILAHIVSHYNGEQMNNLLVHQRIGDRSVIESILINLKAISAFREDFLSSKCAMLLEDLLAVEADAARYQVHHGAPVPTNADDDCKVLMIKVPYVGTIRISRCRLMAIPSPGVNSGEDEHEGVTIGGIGSMHIRITSEGDDPDALSTAACYVYPRQSQGAIELDHNCGPIEQLFPDASAAIDDWVLQGADTAFFDALMSGAGSQQAHGQEMDMWGATGTLA
jgi:hypothetical protein